MTQQLSLSLLVGLVLIPNSFAQENTTIEKTSEQKKHLITFFIVGDLPKNNDAEHPIKVLINEAYAVGYSEERQNPIWSAYHVDKIGNATKHDRPMKFHVDARTDAKVSGERSFRRTGEPKYDRGHMTPNNAIQQEWGRLAQMETFMMSNISPQLSSLNSGLWRDLEHDITERLVEKVDDIWVIAGPVFGNDPKKIKNTDIQIRTGFYMILVDRYYSRTRENMVYGSIAFLFPNSKNELAGKELRDFLVSVDDIEAATKLDFFPGLRQEERFDESRKGSFPFWFGN